MQVLDLDVAQKATIIVRKGNTAELTAIFPNGVNLVGATCVLKVYMRQAEKASVAGTITDQTVKITFTPSSLAALEPTDTPIAGVGNANYTYELKVTYANGAVKTHLVGIFIING